MRILFHRDNQYMFVKPWSTFQVGDIVTKGQVALHMLKSLYQRRIIGCARDGWTKSKVESYKNSVAESEKRNSDELTIAYIIGPWYGLKNANGDFVTNPDNGNELKFRGKAAAEAYLSGITDDGIKSSSTYSSSST